MDIEKLLNIDLSEETILKRRQEAFEASEKNLENMSYWFPKIKGGNRASKLLLPETKMVKLPFDWWSWLRSDRYSDEKIKEFNNYLVGEVGDFRIGETLFMKSGVFSNKFDFHLTVVEDREKIGQQMLDIFYTSMIVGADNTNEVVFREMIVDKENCGTIYNGMPLHTEFRVFYDFDAKKVVGIANYWHPDVMEGNLRGSDVDSYAKEKERIVEEFHTHKSFVKKEVALFMENVSELSGKWSVDIMKNGEDFWLIDMARMNRSALVGQMEEE